jgi:hypothetical protein
LFAAAGGTQWVVEHLAEGSNAAVIVGVAAGGSDAKTHFVGLEDMLSVKRSLRSGMAMLHDLFD